MAAFAGGGLGGIGLNSSITGSSVARGGGGAGGSFIGGTQGTASFGGGNGGVTAVGSPGTDNTGGGAGGGGQGSGINYAGGQGGSGVVIVRYLTADASGKTITGGSKTTSGSYTIHSYTSGTSTFVIA